MQKRKRYNNSEHGNEVEFKNVQVKEINLKVKSNPMKIRKRLM